MKLLGLRANKGGFHPVTFRPDGVSLVVGVRTDTTRAARSKTYNGVGKSLLTYLIDFCLGAKNNKQLARHLPDWVFSLEFLLDGECHCVERSCANQNVVILDGEERRLTSLCKWLEERAFGDLAGVKHLSWRSLVSLFNRQGKPGYLRFDQTHHREQPYTQLIRNSFLLGLDLQLAQNKYELRQQSRKLKALKDSFESDPVLREYFTGNREVNLDLRDLEEEITQLESSLRDFRVAENYEEIERESQETKRRWRELRNEKHVLEQALQQIAHSVREHPDVAASEVAEVYAAAARRLPDLVLRQLHEVERFHRDLLSARRKRLNQERHTLETRLRQLDPELHRLEKLKDQHLQFLREHGAFAEYLVLSDRLADRKHQAQKLHDYRALSSEYGRRMQQTKLRMAEETVKASQYLEDSRTIVDENSERFRTLARRLYPGVPCGLVVRNNEKENELRFDIEAKIHADASDGINECKVFCFDVTLLIARHNHRMNFLVHDSRLFSDMDPRQRAEVFRIAAEYTAHGGLQYIATLNQDLIEGMRSELTEEEFDKLVTQNVVLELTDESAATKLLGIEIDLDYDKVAGAGEEAYVAET